MRLLVVRHGAAADAHEFAATGQGDGARPLTEAGMADMRQAARGLRTLVDDIDAIMASPLLRARQTAEIVAEAYGVQEIATSGALRPESRMGEFHEVLEAQAGGATVALFGHEPHMSTLITWLLTGQEDSRVRMGKGSACLLELTRRAPREPATLRWLLSRKQLIRLGDSHT